LVTSAFTAGKSEESVEARKDLVNIVSQALISLSDDDLQSHAKQISATAHFLGLIIQESAFFTASLDDLKDLIPAFASFIVIRPGEPNLWVSRVLLILEKLLTESAQPKEVKFVPPKEDEEEVAPLETSGFTVSAEAQQPIFFHIMRAVPSIKDDEATALAVVRVLVLLTRERQIAVQMAERHT